ncbi:hypothetical protein ACUOCP_09490, partial [Escherichia sp. R-CC3]
ATDPLTTYPVHVEGGDIFIDLPEAQPSRYVANAANR